MDDYAEVKEFSLCGINNENMLAPSRSRKQANSGLTRVLFLFT